MSSVVTPNANYAMNTKWDFNVNFLYQTGQPITFPEAQYKFMDFSIPNFGTRNGNRLPNYHRLDISVIYKPNREEKSFSGQWVFSLFNAYNRQNAANIRFQKNSVSGQNEAIRLSIFGIIPSVTYNFKL